MNLESRIHNAKIPEELRELLIEMNDEIDSLRKDKGIKPAECSSDTCAMYVAKQ